MKLLTQRGKKINVRRQRHPRVTSVHPVFAQYRRQPTRSFTCGGVLTSGRVCLPVTQKPAVYRFNSKDEAALLIFRISTTRRKHVEGGRETRRTSAERERETMPLGAPPSSPEWSFRKWSVYFSVIQSLCVTDSSTYDGSELAY